MTTMSQDRPLPAPIVNAETETFWKAAAEGKLLLKRSKADGRVHWYPRALCPYTLADTEWFEASGRGTIYSVSVTRRAGPIPFAIAYVTVDEGVTLLTNIVDCDLDSLRIGDAVKVVFKPADGGAMVPMFTPA
ncbi:MAG: DNA-binding protein [Rhizobacter sp.]|nr:DNA-binding protein [Rhizobacter sp.]